MRWTWVCCFVVSFFWMSGAVQADVVNPPPASCPQGATPSTSHAGAYCAPSYCTATTECSDGKTCEQTSVCVKEINGTSNGGPFTLKNVLGPCNNGACSEGTCETAKLCVSKIGCAGCNSQDNAPKQGLWMWFLGLVLLSGLLMSRRRAAIPVVDKKERKG
ncbi:MAG: hypothetical protein H6727_04640 [Myxococcales bacterium]|nr:hypothetical protein [Myxococcales bacterium]